MMAVGRGGYIGRVGLGDGRTNWAAAIDAALLRGHGSPGEAIAELWRSAAPGEPEAPASGWRGTPHLTRRGVPERGPVFAIGDAAGYVEPITGEGMSWAIASGAGVVPCVMARLEGAAPGAWAREHRRVLGARRARCVAVAHAVRHPRALGACLRLAGAAPWASGAIAGALIGACPGGVGSVPA